MQTINRLLYRLTAGRPCRLIDIEGDEYLERYHLGRLFGRTWYLHRFVSSDPREPIHNHGYNGWAVVLSGSYVEEVVEDITPASPSGLLTYHRRVSRFNRIPANKFHAIRSVAPGTWTLFSVGSRLTVPQDPPPGHDRPMATRRKGWGFLRRMSDLDRPDGPGMIWFDPWIESLDPDAWHHTAPLGRDVGRVPL